MQGKKHFQEKLFVSFQLSDHVPEDNFYRRLKDILDLSFLYKDTADYYGSEGQKSVDPVVFMKLMLIGYLENINSDRRIVAQAQMRLDILYFLGYNIDEPLPWHSTLSRTRQLYGHEVFSQVFQVVLKQCIDKGMVAGKRQAVDSVLIKANASLDSMVERDILQDAEVFAGELDENVDELKKTPVLPLPKSSHKNGLAPKKNPQNKTHYSPSDPDAKMSTKPGKPVALNYLGQVGVDTASHVITFAQAFTAEKRDSQCLPEIVEGLLDNFSDSGLKVDELIADTGYSSGEALKALELHQITGYIPNRSQYVADKPGFVYHKDEDCYSCQENKKLLYKGTYETLPGVYNKLYRLSAKVCKVCPLRSDCTAFKKKKGVAIITETVDKDYYQRMHERMQAKNAKRLMKQRASTVEPVIGTLTNYLSLKKINTKGIAQANKCVMLAAAAYNIKKLMKFKSLLLETRMMELVKVVPRAYEREFSCFCSYIGRLTHYGNKMYRC